jgi:hypothetical protein
MSLELFGCSRRLYLERAGGGRKISDVATRVSSKIGQLDGHADVDRELPILGPAVPILESALPDVNAGSAALRSARKWTHWREIYLWLVEER